MDNPSSDIVRKSISLSQTVAEWANELAHKKGFGSNFSAYIADLIRHDHHREANSQAAEMASHFNSLTQSEAVSEMVAVVQKAARRKPARRK